MADNPRIIDSYDNPGAGGEQPISEQDVNKAKDKQGSLRERMNKMRWI